MPIHVAAMYTFVELPDYEALREPLLAVCEANGIKGTILLAEEGMNGTIAGSIEGLDAVLAHLRRDPRFRDLEAKLSPAASAPFYRMKVRLKREIVTMGVPEIRPSQRTGIYVEPEAWNELVSRADVVVVDARNDYEVEIGAFRGAINPRTASFRELPAWLDADPRVRERPKVAMYCTGGIRCEKATAYLRAQGIDEVYHLRGGILNYLETVPERDSLWDGECFVFDERVSVGHGLEVGDYELCRACRRPLGPADRESPGYVPGVSCAICVDLTSDEKKAACSERQRQVELSDARDEPHIGAPQG